MPLIKAQHYRAAPTLLRFVVVAVVAALAQAGQALAAVPPPALVLSARATPASLAPSGGTVTVSGRVLHASTCQLELLSHQSFPVIYSHNPRSCSSGLFTARVTIGPNPTRMARTVALALVARSAASSFPGRFYVRLQPAVPALVLSARATPASLAPSGGTVTVSGRVLHASTCQLELLSHQSFPVIYSRNPRSCSSGLFTARVTIGPNPTRMARTVALALVARNAASSFPGRFYVDLQPAKQGGAVTSLPVTSLVPTPAHLSQLESSNWSGYVAMGGPYAAAKGTFTVPSASGANGSQVSEWVGLDGTAGTGTSLIQAGVSEVPDQANPRGYTIHPWWEVLPAPETPINGFDVTAGDTVTVTIWKVAPGTWEVNLADNTNGRAFTSPPTQYSGPGSSAEWVVEAATRCGISCRTSVLAAYAPPVSFSALGMSGGPQASLEKLVMVQGFQQVSIPSALTSHGFTVSYTGA